MEKQRIHTIKIVHGMEPVTVAQAWDDIGACHFDYNAEAADLGLDPWRLLDDEIDQLTDGSGYLIGSRVVPADYVVFRRAA